MPSNVPERRWSLRRRLVVLVAVVALASSMLTALVLARALVLSNREQAADALTLEADTLAALVTDGRGVRADRRKRVLDARSGWAAEIVAVGSDPTVAPFTAQDVAAASPDAEAVERELAGTDWLVASRPAGPRTVLIARRLAPGGPADAEQRRRSLIGGLLGLAGGGLAGLVLARSVTGPLGRLAGAARRMSAGEREVAVAAEGPAEVADLAEGLQRVVRGALGQRTAPAPVPARGLARAAHSADGGHRVRRGPGRSEPARGRGAARCRGDRRRGGPAAAPGGGPLALARLEADDFALVAAPVDVAALIRAAAAAFTPGRSPVRCVWRWLLRRPARSW